MARWESYNRFGFWSYLTTVLKRADYKCELCRADKSLVFHHIDGKGMAHYRKKGKTSWENVNNSPDNILLVCKKCHAKIHKQSSTKERIQWILELRSVGLSYGKIGKMLGVSRQRVHQLAN